MVESYHVGGCWDLNLNSLRPVSAEESLQPLKSVSLKGNKLIKTLLNYFKSQYNKVT